jgi:hypothetical protein
MKISPAKARLEQKKACVNEPESLCPAAPSRSEDVFEMDGMGDAWLGLMEEDTLFNMQDWEVKDSTSSQE